MNYDFNEYQSQIDYNSFYKNLIELFLEFVNHKE